MKPLIMQLSPATCHFISPLSKYSLSLAPIQNHGQNYSVESFSLEDNISDRFFDRSKLRTRSFGSTELLYYSLSMKKII
jgi:hypothetical protein